MAKAGRKRIEVTPKMIADAERFAATGLTYDQIAAALGIAGDTLRRKRIESKTLDEVIKKGRANAVAEVVNKLYEMAMEKNLGAVIWFLKQYAGHHDSPAFTDAKNEVAPAPVKINVMQYDGRKPPQLERRH